ncbi:hypothetical protein FO441_00960 [Salinicoccus cyprini]|uniref:Uncharacterized protein n=1 Tax=Salinicoccus cyprini TaxID=2493691 RepID=A0A558AXA2_9STAP|nr:hypothetical protein [Salinicoccus cyprini]TVT28881.1 hypothetical protein FO441_00960 [Salinicoccus cyprini]
MKVDVYGSRLLLINMLNLRFDLNVEINNAFIGTTIDSQVKKAVRVDNSKLNSFTSNYELLEIKTDFHKRLRRFHKFSKSSIIVLDLLHEGKPLIKFEEGVLTKRAVLKRYGYQWSDGKTLSYEEKIININQYVDILVDYLSSYELIILNQSRSPKYELNDDGKRTLKKNIEEINFLNFYTETFEDLLSQKLKKVYIIPEYKSISDLHDGYSKEEEYHAFLNKHIMRIFNSEKC